jgi:hypothetical protein
MRKIAKIVIHCSASPNGKQKTLEQLRAEHKARGFSDIGYHWIIQPSGQLLPGRKEGIVGAHVQGHNSDSIGVCMIGLSKFTLQQWGTLAEIVSQLKRKYPRSSVVGHRDLSPDLNGDGKISPNEWVKLCPSFSVEAWLAGGMKPILEATL